jgi:hypothetical protein
MTVAHSARRTANRVSDSKPLEYLTRTGFVGYGIVHLAFAWLALQIALGHPSNEGDQSGAFRQLEQQPFGRVLLMITTIGLVAMAIWQLLETLVGHTDEQGRRRVAERAVSAGRTIVYLFLAWTGFRILTGIQVSSASQQQNATAGLLGSGGGRFLVGFAGLFVIGVGVGMAIYGFKKAFERKLRIGQMRGRTRTVAVRLGQVGYIAKGIAFAVVGLLLGDAAVKHDAAESRGLDGALRVVAHEPFGVFLLILIAFGLAAFGVFCFFQSKYRKV